MTTEQIKPIIYHTLDAYGQMIGESPLPEYDEESTEWCIHRLKYMVDLINDTSPEDAKGLHNAFKSQMEGDGWVYGEEEDTEKKISPYVCEWNDYPADQQVKDKIILALIKECFN